MKKISIHALLCAAILTLTLWVGLAGVPTNDYEIVPIVVSPNVINLRSQAVWVTVHAEIDYSAVVGATVTLDGIPVVSTFADDRGDLVAKFNSADIKGIVQPGMVTLTLSGTTKDGGSFSGSDTIKVVDIGK